MQISHFTYFMRNYVMETEIDTLVRHCSALQTRFSKDDATCVLGYAFSAFVWKFLQRINLKSSSKSH